MGATWLQGKFKALDWRDGIDEIQRQADYKYGYNDGYSGAANTCNFVSKGGCYSMKEKEIAERERIQTRNKAWKELKKL